MVLDLPDGSTVAVAARAVGINENHEWNASVRGRFATSKDLVQDGDRLLLFDAIGGG
jgi:sulfur carrier protein ThiS